MRIGIDVGGTKIEGIALADDGGIAVRHRVPTPQGDYPGTIQAIAALVEHLETATGERGSVGLGTPGALSPRTGRMKNCNSTCLNGQPLIEDVQRALGRPVRLANDADCLALSEATDGAAAGAPTVFAAVLGTGVGGGLVAYGRVLQGPNAIAGEWGHNPLPWPHDNERPGPPCYCGRAGCIETFLSGPGMARDHASVTSETLSAPEIVALAAQGNDACTATLARYVDRLARALATVINLVDPHVVVLGGGMSNVPGLYEDVPAAWGPYVFSDGVDTRLRRAAQALRGRADRPT